MQRLSRLAAECSSAGVHMKSKFAWSSVVGIAAAILAHTLSGNGTAAGVRILSDSEAGSVAAGFIAGGGCYFTTQCVPPALPGAVSCLVTVEKVNGQTQVWCTNTGAVCAATNTSIPRFNEVCSDVPAGNIRDPDFFEEVPQPDPSSVWGCDQFVHPALCITYAEYVCVQRFSYSGIPSGCECRFLNRFGLGALSVCFYGWD